MQRANYDGENCSADVKIRPCGDVLYGTNRGPDDIAVFGIDAETGMLTPSGHTSAQGRWPWNIGIDPSARFLLATNYNSSKVVVLAIDGDSGALTPTGYEVEVPKPVNVCIAPHVGK